MYLIVGLGNPGDRYKFTRHNIGFLVVDALAQHLKAGPEKSEHNAFVYKADDLLLVKPQTFMNLSGEAVQPLMAYYKIPIENILVIHDEVDLAFKEMKMQKKRGHGGHNGIRSIHDKIGNEYARLRLGVGRPSVPQMETADYVLQNFSREQETALPEFISRAAEAVLDFVEDGFERAQNKYNS